MKTLKKSFTYFVVMTTILWSFGVSMLIPSFVLTAEAATPTLLMSYPEDLAIMVPTNAAINAVFNQSLWTSGDNMPQWDAEQGGNVFLCEGQVDEHCMGAINEVPITVSVQSGEGYTNNQIFIEPTAELTPDQDYTVFFIDIFSDGDSWSSDPLVDPYDDDLIFSTGEGGEYPAFIFLGSTSYTGNLGGVTGANQKCQQLATDASLDGNWKALISGSGQNAADILPDTFYGRLDWEPIADNRADLLDGNLMNPITITENGDLYTNYPGHPLTAWTGSDFMGQVASNSHCNNWSGTSGNGTVGLADLDYSGWLGGSTQENIFACNQSLLLFIVLAVTVAERHHQKMAIAETELLTVLAKNVMDQI